MIEGSDLRDLFLNIIEIFSSLYTKYRIAEVQMNIKFWNTISINSLVFCEVISSCKIKIRVSPCQRQLRIKRLYTSISNKSRNAVSDCVSNSRWIGRSTMAGYIINRGYEIVITRNQWRGINASSHWHCTVLQTLMLSEHLSFWIVSIAYPQEI